MDYTLARYRIDALDALVVEIALSKLVERGYPESFRSLAVDPGMAARGLLIDLRLGHILKMDRYKYVKRGLPRDA